MGARILSAAMSLAYVGSVYIFPGGRTREEQPGVLLRRMLGVIILTTVSVFNFGHNSEAWFFTLDSKVEWDILRAVLILHTVYAAPLLAHGIPEYFTLPPQATREDKILILLQFLRNMIVGPVTEELVYRGVMLSVYSSENLSTSAFLAENWIYFGLAHIHHAVMRYLDGVATFRTASLQALFQFGMTSLFGLYSAYWLIKTGSIWPSIITHTLCNFYGPPDLHGPKWYIPTLVLGCGVFIYCFKYI